MGLTHINQREAIGDDPGCLSGCVDVVVVVQIDLSGRLGLKVHCVRIQEKDVPRRDRQRRTYPVPLKGRIVLTRIFECAPDLAHSWRSRLPVGVLGHGVNIGAEFAPVGLFIRDSANLIDLEPAPAVVFEPKITRSRDANDHWLPAILSYR
jgi:hypothetical protein